MIRKGSKQRKTNKRGASTILLAKVLLLVGFLLAARIGIFMIRHLHQEVDEIALSDPFISLAIKEERADVTAEHSSLPAEKLRIWHSTAPVLDDIEIPVWMQPYIDLHKQQSAMAYHTNVATDTNHYLVFTCRKSGPFKAVGGCSGTGNRQRAIQATFLVAMLTNRIFLIDIDHPVQLSHILQSHLVDWNAIPSHLDDLPGVFLNVRNGNPFALDQPQDFAIHKKPQVVRILANSPPTLHAIWASEAMTTYLAPFVSVDRSLRAYRETLKKSIFYALFQPTPALTRNVQQQHYALGLLNGGYENGQLASYTAIHVRAGGDWHGINEARYDVEELKPFYDAAIRLSPNVNDTIVVVSDTLAAKQALQQINPSRIRIVTNATLVHVDRTNKKHQTVDASLDVWTDVLLLAQSTCLVRSAGTFSGLAWKLSEREGQERCVTRVSPSVCNDRAFALKHTAMCFAIK